MPTITEIIGPNGGPIQPSTYTNDASPIVQVALSGSEAAGDLIYLTDTGNRVGPTLTLTAADLARGSVDVQLSGLSDAWHPFIATLADPSGAVIAQSSPFGIAVSTETVAAPTIVSAAAGGATISDGAATSANTVTFNLSEAGLPAPPTGSPGHSPFGGPALLGGVAEILDGHTVVGTAVLGYGGTVSITTQALAAGAHTLTAEAIDRAGNVSALSGAFHVTVGSTGQASAAPSLDGVIAAVLREAPTDPAVAHLEASLSAQLAGGAISLADAVNAVVAAASATSSVATLAYEFFTGAAPSAAGMDYLVASAGPNADNLNSAYYQAFNTENRFINFAVNLGRDGAGAAAFQGAYGNEDLSAATKHAYTAIFGAAPTDAKVAALLDASVSSGGHDMSRADYFALYGGDGANGIGTKAAMVGWLLAEAATSDLGTYAHANDAYLAAVATGAGSFGVDIVGHYGQPGFAYTGG